MNIGILADIQNVLDDIVPVCILHEIQRFLDDTMDKMGSGLTWRGVQAPLNHAASVAVSSNIANAGSNCREDKRCMPVIKFEENPLDHVIAVTIDA
jgi:hypothetical protein